MGKKFQSQLILAFTAISLCFSTSLAYAKKLDERPSPLSMAADALFVRPILLGTTVIGTGLYAVTLPLTLIGGNAEEVGHQFVVVPFKATFVRCLGCTRKHLDDPEDLNR